MIADRIKERRLVLNLTGAQLAENINFSQPYISAIERGVKEPSREALITLAKGLKTSVAYLIGETNNPEALSLPGNVFISQDDVTSRAMWIPVLDIDALRRFATSAGDVRQAAIWTPRCRYPVIDKDVISLSDNADLYIIPAPNNSMAPDITESDFVVFDKRAPQDSGKIVVLSMNGSLMIRGIIKTKEHVTLRARNWQQFQDIEVTAENRFHIFGVVVYSIPPMKKIGSIL